MAELDAEMEDYFPDSNNNGDAMATNDNAGPVDDTNMVDEML